MVEDQIKLHPTPLGKPNGLTVEGLARVIVAMQKDIEWLKKDSEERKSKLDDLHNQLSKVIEILNKRSGWEKSIDQDIEEIKERLEDHERRIRATEKHDWMEIGAVATITSLLTGGIILVILKFVGGG